MLETLYQVFEVVSVVGGLGKIFFWMQSMAQKRKKEDWRKAQTACGAVCARCAIDNNKYFFFFFKIGKSKAENQTSIM